MDKSTNYSLIMVLIPYHTNSKEHFPIYSVVYEWKREIGKILDTHVPTCFFPHFIPDMKEMEVNQVCVIHLSATFFGKYKKYERNIAQRFINRKGFYVGNNNNIEIPIYPVIKHNDSGNAIIGHIDPNFELNLKQTYIEFNQFLRYKIDDAGLFVNFSGPQKTWKINCTVNLDIEKYTQWSNEADEENQKLEESNNAYLEIKTRFDNQIQEYTEQKELENRRVFKENFIKKVLQNKDYSVVSVTNPCADFVNRFDQIDLCIQECLDFIDSFKNDSKKTSERILPYAVLLFELINGEKSWISDSNSNSLVTIETSNMELLFISLPTVEMNLDKLELDQNYKIELKDLLIKRLIRVLKCNELDQLIQHLHAFIRDLHFCKKCSSFDRIEVDLIYEYWLENKYITNDWKSIYRFL